MHHYNNNPGPQSLRWLTIAEKLLNNRDLVGSQTFATRARDSDPNLKEADQILAIADTLIAGEKQIGSNHLDWYAILQIGRRTHDSELIATQYQKLGVLLNPNMNKFAFAEYAFKLVVEAWLVLSNPSKKFQFDNEYSNNSVDFSFNQQHDGIGSSSGGGVHFNFMQEHSEQLHQSEPLQPQFIQPIVQQQQQQQLFPPQPVHFVSQQEEQPLLQQLRWSNQSQQPLFRPQPQQIWLQQPQQQQQQQQQPQQALHWSQVPQQSPISQFQLRPQQPSHEHLAQSQVQLEIGMNGGNVGSHENNVNVEELPNFWTACAYCYQMYEYPGIYAECTLQCQNCKKAFHAVKIDSPPVMAEGEDAYYCCWGFFPIGISASLLEKRKSGVSSWTPFAPIFPQGVNTGKQKNVRNSGPRTYLDDDHDIFEGISSDEETDEDWGIASKRKKSRNYKRKA